MSRKLLAGFGTVLSIAGFVTFIALGIGAWFAKREADRQLDTAALKAHQAGDIAARVIELVREAIARARTSLSTARADSQPPGADPDPMVRIAMWKAKRELPSQVEKARDAVGIASEAVIVAESVLQVFVENKPEDGSLGVRSQDVYVARTQLDSAATELKNARSVLGIPIATGSPDQYTQVEQALTAATNVTNQVSEALTDAQRRVDDVKAQANRLTLRIAIITTLLTALAAIGQVFMFRACRRTWSQGGSPRTASSQPSTNASDAELRQ